MPRVKGVPVKKEKAMSHDIVDAAKLVMKQAKETKRKVAEVQEVEEETESSVEEEEEESSDEEGEKEEKHLDGKNGLMQPTKKRRRKSGTLAIQQIRKLQKTTHELLPKEVVRRVVKEILNETSREDFRITKKAMAALQVVAESYMIDMFKDAGDLMVFSGRVTLEQRDIEMAQRMIMRHQSRR